MSDLVVTVPQNFWAEWILEGDAAGDAPTGETWGFTVGPRRPPVDPGERLYIVAHNRLRGYAPVTKVERVGSTWCIGREAGAVAVTIPKIIKGFRGWQKRSWAIEDEVPFDHWEFSDVPPPIAIQVLIRRYHPPVGELDGLPFGLVHALEVGLAVIQKVLQKDMALAVSGPTIVSMYKAIGHSDQDAQVLYLWFRVIMNEWGWVKDPKLELLLQPIKDAGGL